MICYTNDTISKEKRFNNNLEVNAVMVDTHWRLVKFYGNGLLNHKLGIMYSQVESP